MAMCRAYHQKIVCDCVESFAGRTFNIQRSRPVANFGLDISAVLMKKAVSQSSRFCYP
jgi:hypothetical protein